MIDVEGGTNEQGRIHRALYRSQLMPHDLKRRERVVAFGRTALRGFYTIWDTFRTPHPLLTLVQPQRQRDMVRSLLDTYAHTGWLPDARIAGATGPSQGGSNGDVVIADAIVKDLGGFDEKLGLEALLKDGEVQSDDPLNHGRELSDYRTIGYMSLSQTRSASRTLEYAYDDYAIASAAAKLGRRDIAALRCAVAQLAQPVGCAAPMHPSALRQRALAGEFRVRPRISRRDERMVGRAFLRRHVAAIFNLRAARCRRTDRPARRQGARSSEWLDNFFDEGAYNHGNEPDISRLGCTSTPAGRTGPPSGCARSWPRTTTAAARDCRE